MTDHQQDQQIELKTSSEDSTNNDTGRARQEAPSSTQQESTASDSDGSSVGFTNDGQTTTAALSNSDVVDDSHSLSISRNNTMSMTSLEGNSGCIGRPASGSWMNVTHGGVNVEGAAHSSCSGQASTSSNSPQIRQAVNNDSEMAIVSESMAHASISLPKASEQRPEGAVVDQASNNASKSGQKASPAATSILVVPIAAAPIKPQPGEGKKKKRRAPPPVQPGQSSGRWTHAEHEAFLDGLKIFGREWKKVAKNIPTRTSAQVRSHAQKYFSKLSRDEQLMNQESQAFEAATAAAAGSGVSTTSSAASTAVEAMAAAQAQPPGVQRNVERILANPEQAQRDVEDTLRALRERYQQLQQSLRDHQSLNARQLSSSHRIEEAKEEEPEQLQPQRPENGNEGIEQQPRSGKRRRGDTNGDDCSMSSSTLSSLGNEELIALSVLGATLPNGGGGMAQAPAAQGPSHARRRSNSSLESNSTSNSNSSKSAKRKREDA